MTSRAQQQEYLSSIAQAFDVGEYDYLPPGELQSLNTLIAAAWQAFRQEGDVEACIQEIERAIGHQK